MSSSEFSKEEVQRYVDGMLKPADIRRVERIISANPNARKYYFTQLRHKQLLKMWWKKSLN
jgi:anti-sigma factor RsiW